MQDSRVLSNLPYAQLVIDGLLNGQSVEKLEWKGASTDAPDMNEVLTSLELLSQEGKVNEVRMSLLITSFPS